MGMILGPLFFFYLIIYCLGGLWYLTKVKEFGNKVRFFPVPLFTSLGFGYLYLWLLFSGCRDQEIYAFELYFRILVSLPTTAILIAGLIVFIRLRKKRDNLCHSFCSSILMIPFTALVYLSLYQKELSAYFNVTYYY